MSCVARMRNARVEIGVKQGAVKERPD
jgi:hypothetical protein